MAAQGYKIPFLGIPGGKLNIAGEKEDLDFRLMRNMLESFGEIYSLDISYKARGRVFVCEYTIEEGQSMSLKVCMDGICLYFPSPPLSLSLSCVFVCGR